MPKKILIMSPVWVGDIVMSQSLFRLLKKEHPGCVIDVVAPLWTHDLLRYVPEVHNIIASPVERGKLCLGKRYALGKALRKEQYDWVIVLQNSFKSALIPWFAKIPRRTGWKREGRSILLNDSRLLLKDGYELVIEGYMALGIDADAELSKPYPYPELFVTKEAAAAACEKYHLDPTKAPVLVLCPGAEYGPSKCWPEEYYAKVAEHYKKEGWQVWILGSPKDQQIAASLQAHSNHACTDLTGKTRLAEAVCLLSVADRVVSNDSGLLHVASGLNKPVVGLYGSTASTFAPPLSPYARPLTLNLSCSPCRERVCPLKHHRCLRDLMPEQVITVLESLPLGRETLHG